MRAIPSLLLAIALCSPLFSALVGLPKGRIGNYAAKSGNFTDPIWLQWIPDTPFPKKINPDANPNNPDQDACIGNSNVSVTISTRARSNSWQHRGLRCQTFIKEGADFSVNSFTGQRGDANFVGTISMTGGKFTVRNTFFLCGGAYIEPGVCVFRQTGGILTVEETALNVTCPAPLTASPNAVGTYYFSGGKIRLLCDLPVPERVGIHLGIGKGKFDWTGGDLEAVRLSESLLNNGGRLCPGGDGTIGSTVLTADLPQTYTQSKNGILAVDIAGRSRFDRLVWKSTKRGSSVVLESGAKIEINLIKNYKPMNGASYRIIEADNVVADRIVFTGDGSNGFAFKVDAKGLSLVYAPDKAGRKITEDSK